MDGLLRVAAARLVLQQIDRALRDRQVARTQDGDQAFAVLRDDVHFAEGGDLVDAGVGARIGREYHTGIEHYGDTVSHDYDSPDCEHKSAYSNGWRSS